MTSQVDGTGGHEGIYFLGYPTGPSYSSSPDDFEYRMDHQNGYWLYNTASNPLYPCRMRLFYNDPVYGQGIQLYSTFARCDGSGGSPSWSNHTFTTVTGAKAELWTGQFEPMTDLKYLPTAVTQVLSWDPTIQNWKFWFRGFPDSFQTLPGLSAGKWYMFQSATPGTNVTIPNSTAWSLPGIGQASIQTAVGYKDAVRSGSVASNPQAIASVLPTAVTSVFEWNSATQTWKYWYRGFPDNFHTLASLQRGGTYLLYANAVVTFTMW
jgi:hypothetical protein